MHLGEWQSPYRRALSWSGASAVCNHVYSNPDSIAIPDTNDASTNTPGSSISCARPYRTLLFSILVKVVLTAAFARS